MSIDEKLVSLGITIPIPTSPKGNYVSVVTVGNGTLLHLCGHLPRNISDDSLVIGKVGKDLTIEEGYASARLCAIQILGTLKQELGGNLERVIRIVKVVGFVNCTDDFIQIPAVINGASDLFAQVFGEKGKHARSAVGSCSLPFGVATEVECIVEVSL